MSPTSRPGGAKPPTPARYSSTSAAMEAGSPGYQVPAIGDVRTCPAMSRAVLFIDPVVDPGEQVVAPLEVANDRLLQHRLADERAVEVGEAGHVVARPLLRVLDHGARLHDERPVRGLGQQQLARRLIERPALEGRGRLEAASQLDHALGGHVE